MQPDQTPSAVLKAEHQVILRVIGVLDRLVDRVQAGDPLPTDSLEKCVRFFRLFADACHHAKEEDLLFPALEQRGIPRENGPIGVMIYEHTRARGFTKDMHDALTDHEKNDATAKQRFVDAARQYSQLLNQHIFKEDNILFNMGDQALTADDQQKLCTQFCDVHCRAFEGLKRQQLEQLADQLEAANPPN